MGRKRNPVPSYLLHRTSGQARVKINGRDIYLGVYGSEESKRAYERIVAELRVGTPVTSKSGITVAELILKFWTHATTHYRDPDGTPTSEPGNLRDALQLVLELYEDTPATEFGPLALKAVRQRMIDAGYTRRAINQRINRIRRVWKWAGSEQLVPFDVYEALRLVSGLREGRSEAREKPPVGIVDDATVERTLPHLSKAMAAMVRVQRLTGMRPGEVCGLTTAELDMTDESEGGIWFYRPSKHKTRHRGKTRSVAVGPRAQEILLPFLTDLSPADYVFSPAREVAKWHAERVAVRARPITASTFARRKKSPGWKPGARYGVVTYGATIYRACDRAFPPPGELAQRPKESRDMWRARLTPEQMAELKAWRESHHWHPNQLRHTFATEVRKMYGLEAAGAGLGHTKMSATEVYAERNELLAAKVAREIG